MADEKRAHFRLRDERDEIDVDDEDAPVRHRITAPRLRRGAKPVAPEREAHGARETVMAVIRDIPGFVKLLFRLAKDPRVSAVDKTILVATLGYVFMPFDLIPDFLPFIGQVDDVYLVMLALDRLLGNAGMDVLLDHWDGDVAGLERAIAGLDKAASFLPEPIRRLLHKRVQ
ncbi:MAG: hypothetical protein JWM27_1131 [Gemmatimonadetes bacterium]|nr:hypothetical protein [Gemmatimonadota bacterium]